MGHPVPDVAAPAAKVFRIGADPGAGIDRDRNGSQAELRHSAWAPVSAPGSALGLLLSRALSSAQAVLQSEAVVPSTQPLAPRDRPTARLSRASRNRRSRFSEDPRTETGEFFRRRDVSEHAAHAAKPKSDRSVPTYLYRGNGNGPAARSIEPLPSRGRSAQPASALERLEHLAQTLILDREAVTELRSCEHHAAGQIVQHSLLEAAVAFRPHAALRPPGASCPDWS